MNKKVLIMGLGLHGGGISVAKFFAEKGAEVTITDLKTEDQLKSSIAELKDYKNIKYVLGEHRKDDFINTDLVIRNPGVPKESEFLKIATDNGVDIQMAEGIFFQNVPTKNIIGITGTKGKTTTSYLIYEILKANGLTTHLAGNMKIPVLDILPDIKPDDWVVLELSSWQCEALDENNVSPKIGVITNISQDHLNRYPTYKDYALSKSAIYKHAGNEYFITLSNTLFLDDFLALSKSKNVLIDSEKGLEEYQEVFIQSKLKGEHNYVNMLFAIEVSNILGLSKDKTLNALKEFNGVPYRMESIRTIGNIEFINDTAATAPAAAIAAIKTYGSENVSYILGGADKNLDFQELADLVRSKNLNYVLLKGEGTDKLITAGLDQNKVFDDFEKAIFSSYESLDKSKSGKVVLTPGAASFGLFINEFDRGDKFNEIVGNLK